MTLNRGRLDRVGRVSLTDRQYAELEDCLGLYAKSRLDVPLWMVSDCDGTVAISQRQAQRLRALVECVWWVWHDAGGKGSGARWDVDRMQGPFIRFLQELLQQAEVVRQPASRTLREHLHQFLRDLEPEVRGHNDPTKPPA